MNLGSWSALKSVIFFMIVEILVTARRRGWWSVEILGWIGPMTTFLDDDAVTARLDAATAVAAMRAALVAAHRGELDAPPRVHAGVATFTAGRLAGRWYGYRSYDTHLGGDQVVAVHAEPSGTLAGIAVGRELGALRTGALGGAAVDAMARPEASTLGLIGTGRQAWTQLWAIAAVRTLTDVAVHSRSEAARSVFAERAVAELGVPARAVGTPAEAVAHRDIVVLATSAGSPVLEAGWLWPGTAVTTVGPKQIGRAEFGPDLPARAALVVSDSVAQLNAYDPPAVLADRPVVPLGAVIAGEHPGREDADQITVYASVGLAGTEPYLLAHLLGL
jgi:ornithine cyclodeaminase/alanine dehydrogenase-like protein (mu-crystallin family)